MSTSPADTPHTPAPLANINLGLLLIRVATGGMMLFHGVHKLMHGVDGVKSMLAGAGLPGLFAHGVHVGEVLAPILILLGLFTRPAAALVAFTMVVAIGLAHLGDIFALSPYGGWAIELNMFYLLGALALVFTGAGAYSVRRGQHPLD